MAGYQFPIPNVPVPKIDDYNAQVFAALSKGAQGGGGAGGGATSALAQLLQMQRLQRMQQNAIMGSTASERKEWAAQQQADQAVTALVNNPVFVERYHRIPSLSAESQRKELNALYREFISPLSGLYPGLDTMQIRKRVLGPAETEHQRYAKAVEEAGKSWDYEWGELKKGGIEALGVLKKIIPGGQDTSELAKEIEESVQAIDKASPYAEDVRRRQAEGLGDWFPGGIKGTVARTLPSLAMYLPASALGAAIGTLAGNPLAGAAVASGGLSAAQSDLDYARRVATSNLSEAEKQEAMELGPARIGNTALGAAVGAAIPSVAGAGNFMASLAGRLGPRAAALASSLAKQDTAIGRFFNRGPAQSRVGAIARDVTDVGVGMAGLNAAQMIGSNMAFEGGTGIDTPWLQGVGQAGVAGLVTGGLLGGVQGAFRPVVAPAPAPAPATPPAGGAPQPGTPPPAGGAPQPGTPSGPTVPPNSALAAAIQLDDLPPDPSGAAPRGNPPSPTPTGGGEVVPPVTPVADIVPARQGLLDVLRAVVTQRERQQRSTGVPDRLPEPPPIDPNEPLDPGLQALMDARRPTQQPQTPPAPRQSQQPAPQPVVEPTPTPAPSTTPRTGDVSAARAFLDKIGRALRGGTKGKVAPIFSDRNKLAREMQKALEDVPPEEAYRTLVQMAEDLRGNGELTPATRAALAAAAAHHNARSALAQTFTAADVDALGKYLWSKNKGKYRAENTKAAADIIDNFLRSHNNADYTPEFGAALRAFVESRNPEAGPHVERALTEVRKGRNVEATSEQQFVDANKRMWEQRYGIEQSVPRNDNQGTNGTNRGNPPTDSGVAANPPEPNGAPAPRSAGTLEYAGGTVTRRRTGRAQTQNVGADEAAAPAPQAEGPAAVPGTEPRPAGPDSTGSRPAPESAGEPVGTPVRELGSGERAEGDSSNQPSTARPVDENAARIAEEVDDTAALLQERQGAETGMESLIDSRRTQREKETIDSAGPAEDVNIVFNEHTRLVPPKDGIQNVARYFKFNSRQAVGESALAGVVDYALSSIKAARPEAVRSNVMALREYIKKNFSPENIEQLSKTPESRREKAANELAMGIIDRLHYEDGRVFAENAVIKDMLGLPITKSQRVVADALYRAWDKRPKVLESDLAFLTREANDANMSLLTFINEQTQFDNNNTTLSLFEVPEGAVC